MPMPHEGENSGHRGEHQKLPRWSKARAVAEAMVMAAVGEKLPAPLNTASRKEQHVAASASTVHAAAAHSSAAALPLATCVAAAHVSVEPPSGVSRGVEHESELHLVLSPTRNAPEPLPHSRAPCRGMCVVGCCGQSPPRTPTPPR